MNANPNPASFNPNDIEAIKKQAFKPKKQVVTGGMPYANGPLHMGHLAGALIPPDIYARFMRMLIGAENVLFVCGNDDHGSTSELAALAAGKPIREFIDAIHDKQKKTLERFSIGTDTFSGTSRPDCFPAHAALAQDFIRRLYKNEIQNAKTEKPTAKSAMFAECTMTLQN
jgi:methionyl-tRNA synthetase